MKEHNGFIVLRNGRQIDVVTKNPWTTFVNYDRNWKVELDFPASLDEEFSITTSKQQVGLSDRMWELLREAGVQKAIEQLRKDAKEVRAKYKAEQEAEKRRASELVMQQIEEHKTRQRPETIEQTRESDEALDRMAEEKAKATGLPVEQVQQQILAEAKTRPYKVEEESLPGAPFLQVASSRRAENPLLEYRPPILYGCVRWP